MMADAAPRLFEVIESAMDRGSLQSLVLSQPAQRTGTGAGRVDIRPVRLRSQEMFQWSSQKGPQVFHENHDHRTTLKLLREQVGTDYRHVHVVAQEGRWSARFSRRGKCHLHRDRDAPPAVTRPANVEHNRQRQYQIPEGRPVPFLVHTGIMTPTGQVRSKHFHKFRQINRYVEFVADIVSQLPRNDVIRIVDFGCGKSYLTFATHYYLTQVAGREVAVTGLDRRPDVVQSCREIADRLELSGLSFEVGDIAAFEPRDQVHLAVSLHACDTATDDALAQAVRWGTNVILAVPCCQHELNATLPTDGIPLLSQHGILQERFCSLATDGIRAALLESVGYQTQVLEFIDLEHTPKNLLIRAVKRNPAANRPSASNPALQMQRFCDVFHVPALHLEQRFKELEILLSPGDQQSK